MNLTPQYLPEKDAWNYLSHLTITPEEFYGRKNVYQDVLDQAPEKIRELFLPTVNIPLSEKERSEKVVEILKQEYEKERELSEMKAQKLLNLWEKTTAQTAAYLSYIFQKPFPFTERTLIGYFTSLWICPYDYQEFSIFISMKAAPREQIRGIIHELNHFMFYYYYPDLHNDLKPGNYELLKESLTFFTNPEQPGYPGEKPLRNLYASKRWESLDRAIKEGAEFLRNN